MKPRKPLLGSHSLNVVWSIQCPVPPLVMHRTLIIYIPFQFSLPPLPLSFPYRTKTLGYVTYLVPLPFQPAEISVCKVWWGNCLEADSEQNVS